MQRPDSNSYSLEMEKFIAEQRHRAEFRTNEDFNSVNQQYIGMQNLQQEIAIKFASIAINSLVFASGGSIVALIAYVGNLSPGYVLPESIFWGFCLFFYSVLMAILCSASAYLAQNCLLDFSRLNWELELTTVIAASESNSNKVQNIFANYVKNQNTKIKKANILWKAHLYTSMCLWILSAVLFLGGGYFCLISFDMM